MNKSKSVWEKSGVPARRDRASSPRNTATNYVAVAPIVALLLATAALCRADVEAITKPSQDVTLSFVHPGLVAQVMVKEGDHVNKDDVVVKER